MTDETPQDTATPVRAEGVSLAERAQRRHQELSHAPESTLVLPVPGYEDIMSVRYRPLTFRENWDIETRHTKPGETPSSEEALFIAADKLIVACKGLVEPDGVDETGSPKFKDTGYKWNRRAAVEVFGCTLPADATARASILAIFGPDDGEESLIIHAGDYGVGRDALKSKVDRRVEGESGASSAAI